jgi:choline kinase
MNAKTFQTLSAETTALILAAGLGSRLGSNTKERPKCLVPVAGRPMLQRMLDNLQAQGIDSVVIAVGYLADQIKQFVQQHYPQLAVTFIENPSYAVTGSVYSLDLALRAVPPGQNVLLIEGDVVLDPALLTQTLNAALHTPDAATLLAPYDPTLSGTFAWIDEGRVSAWLHESVRAKDTVLQHAYKTVNITFVHQHAPLTKLRAAIQSTIEQDGVKAPLEYAMQALVQGGMQIAAVVTTGLPWFEVDTPEDLQIADNLFGPAAAAA